MMRHSSGARQAQLLVDDEAAAAAAKRSVKNSTPALKGSAAFRGGLGVSDAPERAQLAAIDAHDLVQLEQHGSRSNAMPFNDRLRISPAIGASCGQVTQMLIGVLLRNAAEHALAGVLEPMALGGIERARAAAAFVVALEHALDAVRRAAEEAVGVPACRWVRARRDWPAALARGRRPRAVAGRRARRRPRRAARSRRRRGCRRARAARACDSSRE